MKLLVLAQLPPPVHGQSLMVQTLVEGLPARGVALHHVNLGLSRDAADIGRWRPGKIFTTLSACLRTIAARFRHDCDTLYYIPAPGKRGALYRDWVVMLLCRPFFPKLVLHWHATGLGDWLETRGTFIEAWFSRLLLGRAELSLALSESLQSDAQKLRAKKIRIVPNGIADPGVQPSASPKPDNLFHVLFLGQCSEEKGLFVTADAVLAANLRLVSSGSPTRFVLNVAGAFVDSATENRFNELRAANPSALLHLGFVFGAEKAQLFRESDCLCLPSRYAAEGQPLVLLEAMVHDLPVVTSRWRGIPDTLPPEAILLSNSDPQQLADALLKWSDTPPVAGIFRQHYLKHFTVERHLRTFTDALKELD